MSTKKTLTFQLDTADLTLALSMLDADRGAVEGFTGTSGVVIAGERDYWATITLPTGVTDGFLQIRSGGTLLREIGIGLGFEVADRTSLADLIVKFAGISSLAHWLRTMFRSSTPDATALAEINASGGAYDATTDSLQALRDRGDSAWAGGGGGSVVPLTARVVAQIFAAGPTSLVPLVMGQAEQTTYMLEVLDGTGAAVELDGKALRFVVEDSHGDGVFKIESGTYLTVAAASGATIKNVVSITVRPSQSNIAGGLKGMYQLWNTTDDQILVRGYFNVIALKKDVA